MSLIAIIPAYNEEPTIAGVVSATLAISGISAVIVVDDGSTDGTAAAARQAGADVHGGNRNLGKGPRLDQGIKQAFEKGAERVVLLDGDGQHNPADLPMFISLSDENPGSLIIGNRTADMAKMPRGRARSIRFGDFFIGWACGQTINDAQCGMRLLPRTLWQKLHVPKRHIQGFVYETAMLIYAAKAGARITPVPIRARYGEVLQRSSHFRPATDFAKIAWMVTEFLLLHGMRPRGLLIALGILR